MNIEPRFLIELKGKSFVLYAGLLDAASRQGLKEMTVRLLQVPGPENQHLAIAEAVARFEDGRQFTEIGDAGPQNLAASMVSAACRMAATRAKARCLRDALNVGVCSFEELPPPGSEEALPARESAPAAIIPLAVTDGHEGVPCTACGLVLRPAQVTLALQRTGRVLCPAHQRGAKVEAGRNPAG